MLRRIPLVVALALLLTLSLSVDVLLGARVYPPGFVSADTVTASAEDIVRRACSQPTETLRRIWRGYDPERSEDITFIPREPNYLGSFTVTSHSGPADRLQTVPLVLYGPGVVAGAGVRSDEVTLADVYDTAGKLLGVPLEPRPGHVLPGAIAADASVPKLLVVVVWDGAGRNVLDRWPDAWPTLARLEGAGTSYVNATVGSSPSITPATHATLGTGAFPRSHRVTAIQYRKPDGSIAVSFAQRDTSVLALPTFADQIDVALDNEPKVGLVGWRGWHLGMLGHGTNTPGGDRDQLGIIGFDSRIMGDPDAFSTPAYLHGFPGLGSLLAKTDASDGERDGLWMGHPVAEEQDNPGWVAYQTQVVEGLMGREGYGRDGVPDILFLNYKTTDIVGHRYSMDSPEMGLVLRAQDEALGELVDYLDTNVDGYALVVTADHGHTPSPRSSGGWPIDQRELERDLDARFGITGSRGLALATSAVGPFLDRGLMAERGITADAVAGFLERYTIAENWSGGSLPPGYGSRADETIFQAVWPSARLPEIMSCAFGNSRIGR